MIGRVWRGWATGEGADRYERHHNSEIASTLRRVSGFRGARLLRREAHGETEFVSITFFDDLDAVRAFACEDDETAVVAGEAREAQSRFEDRVLHYEVPFEA